MELQNETVCLYALSLIPGVGSLTARRLYDLVGSAEEIFTSSSSLIHRNPRFWDRIQNAIASGNVLVRARQDLQRASDKGIGIIPFHSPDYPHRLRACVDAPLILFAQGNLNALKNKVLLSVVGTRQCDAYGRDMTQRLLGQLKEAIGSYTVVSGLAYGIDIAAHRAALAHDLPTIAVLGHGLDRIYPSVHRNTAMEMLHQGALLSEYDLGTAPDRFHFVNRNRIVAGVSDATLVVQSAEKGGSLITARLAFGYDRSVFAVPGRLTDPLSEGCNRLIAQNMAASALSGQEIAMEAGWKIIQQESQPTPEVVPTLPLEDPQAESPQEQILQLIRQEEGVMIDDLCYRLGLNIQDVSLCLFHLEMQGVVQTAPGGLYIPKFS